MLEIFTLLLFCWLFFKFIGLFLRVTWGAAKLMALVLLGIALLVLLASLVFAGGLLLLVPLALLGLAFGLLKKAL